MGGTNYYREKETSKIVGAVFFRPTNTSSVEQQWQIFPVNATTYVLRSRAAGHTGYLGARSLFDIGRNGTFPSDTAPYIANYTASDASMYWQLTSWGDGKGTFYMANKANGTRFHIQKESDGLMSMSGEIEAPQGDQAFKFLPLDDINNGFFSTVDVGFRDAA
jgi:hypothetical protein